MRLPFFPYIFIYIFSFNFYYEFFILEDTIYLKISLLRTISLLKLQNIINLSSTQIINQQL